MQTNNWHKLDKYIMGKASKQESEEVKELIKNDPDFAYEAELHQQIINVIIARSEHKLIDKIAQWEDSYPRPKAKSTVSLRKYVPALAAIILTLISLSILFFSKSESSNAKDSYDLYANYFIPYPDLITTRNSSEDRSTLELMRSYNAGEFEEANEAFRDVESRLGEIASPLLFYYGVSLIGAKRYDEAIEKLSKVDAEAYSEATEWYLSLAYSLSGDMDTAKKLLSRIAHNSDHAYFEEANSIQDQLASQKN